MRRIRYGAGQDFAGLGRGVALLALGAVAIVGMAPARPASAPLNVEDMLSMERIGRVEVAGGGRLVLYEHGGPKEGFTDYGIDDTTASGRVYVYDVARHSAPTPLLHDFPFPNWIGAVSPKGGKLALYWLDHSYVKAGVIDLVSGKLVKFAFNPTFDFQVSAPLWTSEDTLIYSAEPEGAHSPRVDFRRRAALIESEGRERAWKGGTSARVLESHATEFTPEWRPGSLLRVDANSGKTTVLAQGKYVELALSPDNRFLAAARQGHYMRFPPDSGKQTYDAHRLEPRIIDLNPASPQPAVALCQGCQLSGLADFVWSPDGQRVSFFARFGTEEWERARFRIFDAEKKSLLEVRHVGLDLASQRETGAGGNAPVTAIPFADGALVPARKQLDAKAEPIFTFKEAVSIARYGLVRSEYEATLGRLDWYFIAPDGTSRAVTSALSDVQSNTVASDRRGLYFLAGNKVVRTELNGTLRDVATLAGPGLLYKLDGSIDDGGRAVAVAANPDDSRTVQFFEGTTERRSVKTAPGIGVPLAVDPRSGVVVFQSMGTNGSALTLVDRAGGIQPILEINTHLRNVALAKQVMLKYTLPNGESTQACLTLPANAEPGNPLPMIVSVYPVEGRCRNIWRYGFANTYDDELFTGFGYAVLHPATPARLLREGSNPAAHWGSLVEAAVSEAVKEGYADKDRLGIWGMSLGGHSVLSTLAQTSIFKAGAAANGAADFFSNYASLGLVRNMLSDDLFAVGHSVMYEGAPDEGLYIGAPPWERPEAYAAASPLAHAGTMNTPLMLLAGDLDWDYQMAEFDQYYIALLRQGKEAVYVQYMGEGHGNFSPDNVRDTWKRLHEWFDTHLGVHQKGVHQK
jgi:dipeptidyl aminopeptidase/acylaminoacyl peptidase